MCDFSNKCQKLSREKDDFKPYFHENIKKTKRFGSLITERTNPHCSWGRLTLCYHNFIYFLLKHSWLTVLYYFQLYDLVTPYFQNYTQSFKIIHIQSYYKLLTIFSLLDIISMWFIYLLLVVCTLSSPFYIGEHKANK